MKISKPNKLITLFKDLNNKVLKYYYKIILDLENIKFGKYHLFKNNIIKYIILLILLILFFDKIILLIATSIIYLYNKYINILSKNIEKFNNNLDSVIFEPSNNTVNQYSSIFKNPELNLASYNNVKFDPNEVLLQNNKFLPECCYYNSEYSTSKGCACITPLQQDYLRSRGSNKSNSSFLQENNDYKNLYFSPSLALLGDKIPFKKQDENYIVDYKPLTSEKINDFNKLINLSSYGEENKVTEKINTKVEKYFNPNTISFSIL